MLRRDAEPLGHDADDVGLRDRLAEADRQRVVAVGPGAERLGDEAVPGDLAHRPRAPGDRRRRGARRIWRPSRGAGLLPGSAAGRRPARGRRATALTRMIAGAAPESRRRATCFLLPVKCETGLRCAQLRRTEEESDLGNPGRRRDRTGHPHRRRLARRGTQVVRADAPGARARRQGAELPQAGPRLELPRALRRARRDPARARDDVPARAATISSPTTATSTTCVAAGPDGRGDPPERHVARRPTSPPAAGTCPTTSPSPRSASRTSPPASPTTRSTPRASPGRSRPIARTRSSSARSASRRPPRATSTRRSTARRARSCRSSSSSRTTATGSRSPRATRRRTSTPPTTSRASRTSRSSTATGSTSSTRSARCARRSRSSARARARRSSTRRCVRIHSHSNSDRHELYRTPEELAAAQAADPLPRFRKLLLETGLLSDEELRAIEAQNERPTRRPPTAPRRRPSPTRRRSTTSSCPSPGSRRPGPRAFPTAPARR